LTIVPVVVIIINQQGRDPGERELPGSGQHHLDPGGTDINQRTHASPRRSLIPEREPTTNDTLAIFAEGYVALSRLAFRLERIEARLDVLEDLSVLDLFAEEVSA
jgi:hypothetical protein